MSDSVMSLYELNNLVHELVETNLDRTFRVRAELSEVRLSARGHCFVELIEKRPSDGVTVAKARGVIMAGIFPLLKMDFEETTGQAFAAGLTVLLEVKPTFSEIYGYSLIVTDIDATYTLGDMVRRRREIMDRLEREGVAGLNQSLTLPELVKRIAVISSPTAAGYGDFCRQIDDNPYGLPFNHKLFPALMQGEATARSVIAALDRIFNEETRWDAVVIIRGGGAVSDLGGFENYDLAASVAQFPLPVITGIGHERDTTVLDLVANVSLKTPTAVADFLVERMARALARLDSATERLTAATRNLLDRQTTRLQQAELYVSRFHQEFISHNRLRLDHLANALTTAVNHSLNLASARLDQRSQSLNAAIRQRLNAEQQRLRLARQTIEMSDPQRILSLGYSITLHQGRVLRDATLLHNGDTVETRLQKGSFSSTVEQTDENSK